MNRRTRATCVAVIIAAGLFFTGCAADSTDLDDQTSRQWQTRVLEIAESAEAGDHATALVDLAALESDAAQSRQDGEISAERAAIIQQSIDAVRADLEAALPDPVVPVPEDAVTDDTEPEPETETDEDDGSGGEDKNNKGDNGNKNGNKDDKDNNGNGNGN